MSNFSKNIACLRKDKNLSQKQAAQIFGLDLETYQKLEFDIQEPSLDEISKISEFYDVDAYDLKNGIVSTVSNEETIKSSIKEEKSNKNNNQNNEVENAEKGKFPKKLTIALLVMSIIVAFCYFILPVTGWQIDTEYFSGSEVYSFLSFLNENVKTIYILDAVIVLFINLWMLASYIILLSSKKAQNGNFSYVCEILNIVFASFLLLNSVLICLYAGYTYFILLYWALYAIEIVLTVVALIKHNKSKKNNRI